MSTLSGSLSKGATAGKSRYEMAGKSAATREGRVGIGTDRNGDAFLVHMVGRQSEAIALHAVGSALALLGTDDIAQACANLGILDKLSASVTRAQAIETAKKAPAKKAAEPK